MNDVSEQYCFILNRFNNELNWDLNNVFLCADIQLESKGRTKLIPNDQMSSCVNNILFSAFSSLKVYFNSSEILNINNYPLYNYTSKLLSFNDNAFKTYLATSGWHSDTV